MRHLTYTVFLFLLLISFSSCSDRIAGQWRIARFENKKPGEEGTKAFNMGTIRFNNNQTGERTIPGGALVGAGLDKRTFNWSIAENYLTITSDDRESAKTWIRTKNKRKLQILTSTNGAEKVQVLELRK